MSLVPPNRGGGRAHFCGSEWTSGGTRLLSASFGGCSTADVRPGHTLLGHTGHCQDAAGTVPQGDCRECTSKQTLRRRYQYTARTLPAHFRANTGALGHCYGTLEALLAAHGNSPGHLRDNEILLGTVGTVKGHSTGRGPCCALHPPRYALHGLPRYFRCGLAQCGAARCCRGMHLVNQVAVVLGQGVVEELPRLASDLAVIMRHILLQMAVVMVLVHNAEEFRCAHDRCIVERRVVHEPVIVRHTPHGKIFDVDPKIRLPSESKVVHSPTGIPTPNAAAVFLSIQFLREAWDMCLLAVGKRRGLRL